MSAKIKVFIAMIVAMLFWGYSFIWSQEVLAFYNPSTTVLFRLIISITLLLIANIWLKKRQKIRGKDLRTMFLLSLFQPFLYFIGENYGLMQVSSTVTAVVISTIPLFSPIAAFFLLKEKLKIMNFVGVTISILGVFLVILKDDFTIAATLEGILFLFLAVFSAVMYTVIISKMSGRYNVFTIISYQNAIGILYFIPAFFILDYKHFMNVGFKLEPFIPLIQLALFGSTVAYILFIYGIQKLGITKANIFANIIPVFTAMFSFVFLHEKFNFLNIIGILIVVSGLLSTQISKLKFNRNGNSKNLDNLLNK
jgi:drug/metabolite transporter (DMT)-like permease